MVSEEAALFRSEEVFAGIRDVFNRKTWGRPLRKSRGGLPEKHDVVRAGLLGRIERGGIHCRAIRSAGCVIRILGKSGWRSLSRGDGSQPSSCLARASSSGPGSEAYWSGPVVFAVPETFRGGAGGSQPVHLDWVGETYDAIC